MKYTFTFISILLWSSFCFSQSLKTPTLSPFSKISQEIGLTEVSLEYSRPSAKGRTVFNGLVPYDQVWRTGANASTKITLNEPALIGGKFIQALGDFRDDLDQQFIAGRIVLAEFFGA